MQETHRIDPVFEEYLKERSRIIALEQSQLIGHDVILSSGEQILNQQLMTEKTTLYLNESLYPLIGRFHTLRHQMAKTFGFEVIRAMPKGAALHVHLDSSASTRWVVKNLTYWEQLFVRFGADGRPVFQFTAKAPVGWRLVSELRAAAPSEEQFDRWLNRFLSLTEREMNQPRQDLIWSAFQAKFLAVSGILTFEPAFRAYLQETMQRFRQDNVQYVEYRLLKFKLYNFLGQFYPEDHFIQVFQEEAYSFSAAHPDVIRPRLILTPMRDATPDLILQDLLWTQKMMQKYPNTVVGWDLVGEEDSLHTLLYYAPTILKFLKNGASQPLKFFYHAGETDRMNAPTDENLVDSLLLNSTRIGHAFAILRHPVIMEQLKKRDIPMEVNPLSNHILGLVSDWRNHPATVAIQMGQPLVISSDDPGLWHALPLSHDFYITFMAMSGLTGDLATMKKLAMNSIKYTTLSAGERNRLEQIWMQKWNAFILHFLLKHRTQ